MTERTMTKADLVTSLLLIVFSAAIVVSSMAMPTMADRNASPFSGPGVVPVFIGAMLLLLSVTMLIRSMRRGVVKSIADDKGAPKSGDRASYARIARTVGLCIVYTMLLGRVWFALITFLFVFIFVMMFEYDPKVPFAGQWKKPLFAALLALATAASVFFVFQYLFLVNLP